MRSFKGEIEKHISKTQFINKHAIGQNDKPKHHQHCHNSDVNMIGNKVDDLIDFVAR